MSLRRMTRLSRHHLPSPSFNDTFYPELEISEVYAKIRGTISSENGMLPDPKKWPCLTGGVLSHQVVFLMFKSMPPRI